jgi:hypothetical protein
MKMEQKSLTVAIEITRERLAKLKDGLTAGKPAHELHKLAREIAIAATSIETILAHQ